MTFVASVSFSGLCGFVFNRAIDSKAVTSARVVLPETAEAAHQLAMATHYSVLTVPFDRLTKSSRPPDLVFQRKPSDAFVAVFLINRLDLSFRCTTPTGSYPLELDDSVPDDLTSPTQNLSSLRFILPLDNALPYASAVQSHVLSAVPDISEVAARVRITEGRLSSSQLTYANGKYVSWVVDQPNGKRWKQVLADVVQLDLANQAGEFVISGTAFGGSGPSLEVFLSPDASMHVGADVMCLEWEGILELPRTQRDAAKDLQLLYILAAGSDPKVLERLPYPIAFGGGGPVHCPFAMFRPDAGA